MHLTTDQQKRLLAAELASKTMTPGNPSQDPIELATRWLAFLDGGTQPYPNGEMGKLLDIAGGKDGK